VDAGHFEVGDDGVEALGLQHGKRRARRFGCDDLVSVELEKFAKAQGGPEVVIDDEHALHAPPSDSGKRTSTSAPPFGLTLRTRISPPCARTMSRTMARPSPEPSGFVV